jgi:hypothetical protein
MALPEIVSPQESSSIGVDPCEWPLRLDRPPGVASRWLRQPRPSGRELDNGSPRKTVLRRIRQLDPMRRSDHGSCRWRRRLDD